MDKKKSDASFLQEKKTQKKSNSTKKNETTTKKIVRKKSNNKKLKRIITIVLASSLLVAGLFVGFFVWQNNVHYKISFTATPGVIFSDYESLKVKNGDDFTFKINLKEDVKTYEHLFVVKANNKIITPVEEVYYVNKVKEHITITIAGVGSKNLNIQNEVLLGSTGATPLLIIPFGVTQIADNAFLSKTDIVSVHIPNSVTKLGFAAFRGAVNLEEISLSNNINDFGALAFFETKWYSKQLDGLIYINNWVYQFKNTASISTLMIKDGIVGIAPMAFMSLNNLQQIELPNTLLYIEDNAFTGTALRNITFPSKLKVIGTSAFSSTKLENLIFPNSLQKVHDNAFAFCRDLKEVQFNSNISLHNSVFGGCTSLEKVSFNNGLQELSEYLFASCTNLNVIIINSNTVPQLAHSNAFFETNANLQIYVPESSLTAFRTAEGWSVFSDIIKSINNLPFES